MSNQTVSTPSLTRTVDGQELPTAGTYAIDASHSNVGFTARHLMVTKVRGNFADVAGTIEIADQPEQSSVEVVIGAASIDTRSPDRDGHLKSADFLDVERFPELRYRSTSVRRSGRRWQLEGELTVRDVTRPVVLDVEFEGGATDPWGGSRISFTAKGDLDREDFGITWNQALETGGVLVSRKVQIELDVQAVRQ